MKKPFDLQGMVSVGDPEWRVIARSIPKLKYCPVCMKEEVEAYGESYWHREHQIPSITACRKHKCRLIDYKCNGRLQLAEKPVLPENIWDGNRPDYFTEPFELPLAETLDAYMTLPIKAGPTEGYHFQLLVIHLLAYSEMMMTKVVKVAACIVHGMGQDGNLMETLQLNFHHRVWK